MDAPLDARSVIVACPDARPPAYQAVIGLSQAGLLRTFLTAAYYDPQGRLPALARRLAPDPFSRIERVLLRRHHDEIPARSVAMVPAVDLALGLENHCAGRSQTLKRRIAQTRTGWFDRRLALLLLRKQPGALFVFSDVGSAAALPLCRRLGIPAILSMVHGDVREEAEILSQEAVHAPEFFSIYLGDGRIDQAEMAWLHARRLRDLALADLILVPSEHIAQLLETYGTPRSKIRVLPYAADCRRFRPQEGKQHGPGCTFLFAGGITQRKGIKYLLEAWSRIRRPGWKLQLLGAMPKDFQPLRPWLDQVEILGRVAHADVPAVMTSADVFVFPSLFEGSAVVTYEALACGLPSVVTPSAGSVVRDGIEGFQVPPRDVDGLAERMERLGNSPELRARMARAARQRACEFHWARYHQGVVAAVEHVLHQVSERAERGVTSGPFTGRRQFEEQ